MSTFSQLVDELTVEHLRPDLRVTISSYLNATIREVHMHEQTQVPVYYDSNRLEVEVTISGSPPALWEIPKVTRFQAVDAIYYSDFGVYAVKRAPTKVYAPHLQGSPYYWYRSGQTIALGGLNATNKAKISWFEYPKTLLYYAAAARPMVWNVETESPSFQTVGAVDYNSTPELQATALELTTNWLIQRWAEMLKQGVRNKVFARLGEMDRTRTSYSMYASQRAQCINSESMELNTVYGG
jgi:hypothetical protein